MKDTVRDPVCGMNVPRGDPQVNHLGIWFSFCSEQCLQRFLANPYLYVGVPGRKAPKQEGREIIKRRRLRLAAALTDADAAAVMRGLRQMMGVKSVEVTGHDIAIVYDLLQVTERQLEDQLAHLGARLGAGWAERMRHAFVHYLEETEVGNLAVRNDPYTHGNS